MANIRNPLLIDTSRASFGFACWSGDPGPMTVAHRHDDIEVNVADDDIDYVLHGTRLTIPAGRAGVFWASRPHQLAHVPAGTRVAWLTVPLPEFLAWGLPAPFVADLLRGRMIIPDVPPAEIGGDLARWEQDARSGSPFASDTSRLEVNAFLRRVSTAPDAAPTISRPTPPGGAVESAATMAAFIAARFAEPLTVDSVSASAHVQPSTAIAMFRRVVGITIGAYVTQCRVAEAQRLLIATDLAVTEVGAASGFGSASQFYERFQRACGVSPAVYRRRNSLQGVADGRSDAPPQALRGV